MSMITRRLNSSSVSVEVGRSGRGRGGGVNIHCAAEMSMGDLKTLSQVGARCILVLVCVHVVSESYNS